MRITHALLAAALASTAPLAAVLPDEIEYSVHASGVGWTGWQRDGAPAGTVGQDRPVEGIKIRLVGDLRDSYDLSYQCHMAGAGWSGWSEDGESCGTEGQMRQLEAVRIKLSPRDGGDEGVEIRYRAHSAKVGWGRWVGASEVAGTTGKGLALEALAIRLEGSDPTWNPIGDAIEYTGHSAGVGWLGWSVDGATCGTTGKGRALEAIKIRLGDAARGPGLSLSYQIHASGAGDSGNCHEGEMCGTEGQSRQIEALRMFLDGGRGRYRVAYRAHSAKVGWGPWVTEDQWAGTRGKGLGLEAFQARIERRGGRR